MATKTQISLEEYLTTAYEPECEFVRGEIVEKVLGQNDHSKAQANLIGLLWLLSKCAKVFCRAEIRLRMAPDLIRVPDVALFAQEPEESVPSFPPLVAVEIAPPDDRLTQTTEKLREYRAFGIPNVWLIDPNVHRLWVFDLNGLREVPSLTLPEYGFEVTPADLF